MKSISAALAKAQASFVQPKKNKTVTVYPKNGGKSYSFDYADYSEIVDAVRGPLSENGIAFTHMLEFRDSKLLLVTKLIHGESGELLESVWPMTSSDDPKEVGGDMTYGKRYSLSAITGCVADDDADGDNPNGSKGTGAFADRRPTETDVPDGGPRAPAATGTNPVKIGAKPGAPANVSKSVDEGKKWSAFWAGARDYGWTSEEVHAKAYEDFNVSTLTALSPEQLAALRQFIKANPKVQN